MKKILSLLLAVIMICGLIPYAAIGTTAATTSVNKWPGQAMNIYDDTSNIYYFDIPLEYNWFIFSDGNYYNGQNNGVAWQTDDLTFEGNNKLYSPNLNDTSYVNGATRCSASSSDCTYTNISRRVFFKAPDNWETPSCYCWASDDYVYEPNNKPNPAIPSDAYEFNGNYYKVYRDVCNTWEEAKAYCESLGGYLATIVSEEENSAVFSYVTSSGYKNAYFGYHDSKTEGKWEWVNGETSTYTNWHLDEPNSADSLEDYAMFYYKYSDGTWNDGNFRQGTDNDDTTFICEWESSMVDSDQDGLFDLWETKGLDYNGDGTIDVDLPAMGANPSIPDVFVEVDWMVRPKEQFLWFETQKSRNMAPSSNAMKLVYNTFKSHGINLHIDVGPNSTDFVNGKLWGSLSGGNEIPYEKMFDINTSWYNTLTTNFSENRHGVFKHCLFIDQFDGTTSGIANNIPGQFFIVANQDWVFNGGDTSVAGTFMHELGHTLGLCHGGSDHEHYKPNYLSVMNYAFQTTGLAGTGTLNYSDYKLPDIDESHINESLGVDPFGLTAGTGLGTTIFYRDKNQREIIPISKTAIDFNNNGTLEHDISLDLNPKGNVHSESIAVLRGHQDWDGIVFNGGLVGNPNSSSSGIDFSINETGLEEKTLEESLKTSTLAIENTGYIELLPSTLIVGLDGQYLEFEVGNLSANDSIYRVDIVCDDLFNSFSTSAELLGSEVEIENKHIVVPITKPLVEREYTIKCSIDSEKNVVEYVFYIDAITVNAQDVNDMKQQIADDDYLDEIDTEKINDLILVYEAEIELGDVEGDLSITILDATTIQKHLAELPIDAFVETTADTDKDGVISIMDATMIQRYLAELITEF